MKPWRVIAWMCAAHVTSMAGFSTYATLLPRLQHEWGLNNSQAGFISGAYRPWGLAFTSLGAGAIAMACAIRRRAAYALEP